MTALRSVWFMSWWAMASTPKRMGLNACSITALQVQGGIESIIDDVFYGQLPVPSLGGGVGYGATAVECWTLVRGQVPDGVDVPVSDAGVAPWTH